MKCNQEQREFLREFFEDNRRFIRERDMLEPDDIKVFADIYSNYLENSKFRDDSYLKTFLLELKKSQYYETLVKNGKVELTPRQRMIRKRVSDTSSKCNNKVIKKWISIAKISSIVSSVEIDELNTRLEPIRKQNAKELRLSWKETHDKWFR